jgi:hypothetical protein
VRVAQLVPSAMSSGMHWHKYEPPGCAATTSRPRKE